MVSGGARRANADGGFTGPAPKKEERRSFSPPNHDDRQDVSGGERGNADGVEQVHDFLRWARSGAAPVRSAGAAPTRSFAAASESAERSSAASESAELWRRTFDGHQASYRGARLGLEMWRGA
jgi:hypothetical protein